ncbi:Protein of unknown function [Pyronema omphalodes CBS 100304]|uniref:Uncharacterized protein n=1 Tax=Pyronema omphalodes (strain CBS 100304) TaxID=1076935 RepID=U4LJ41_PYROM|nr:Protein of unknown function [Pyronema omphalodes CBS 100304]
MVVMIAVPVPKTCADTGRNNFVMSSGRVDC